MDVENREYGVGDNSYQAAGALEGLTRLVDQFYDNMDQLAEFAYIRGMHRESLTESRQKLTYFLSGWLGGPRLYASHFGSINIPQAHQHLTVGIERRDGWLACMQLAIADQPYEPAFKTYLIEQLAVPAERIRLTSVDP